MENICTGNPNQLWAYDEPDINGENRHVIKSEKEIFEEYSEYWSRKMIQMGKKDLISEPDCIDDWIILNWAYKVNKED